MTNDRNCATFRPMPSEVRYGVNVTRRSDGAVVVRTAPTLYEDMAPLLRPLRALYQTDEYKLHVEVIHGAG